MQHPLCANNATAYVGQTAKMYCCLARLDRELSVSKNFSYFYVLSTCITAGEGRDN